MTGKFTDHKNWVYQTVCAGLLIICLTAMAVLFAVDFHARAIIFAALIIAIPVCEPFSRCSYNADEEKIVFRLGFFSFTYKYSETESAETYTNIDNDRFHGSPYIQININLKNGDTVTFYDLNIPSRVSITPKKYKMFIDEHQFTALCGFINERVSKNLY